MPHVKEAFDWFENHWVRFQKLKMKSMLYVGWTKSTKDWWRQDFREALGIETYNVIDVFAQNASQARRFLSVNAIHGNIGAVDSYINKGEYDLIFWDHGPEHVPEEKLTEILNLLKEYAGKCVIAACPWGNFPQEAIGRNTFEAHLFDVVRY